MNKQYIHSQFEDAIYKKWEDSGGFRPKDDKDAETYCIIMPPPNANDPLHVGHAMFVTIEDILIRYNRMRGKAVLWLPGTDHAGIETQFVFEKKLKKTGKSRFDYDRDTLYKMIWDYVDENSGVAVSQMKKLGASADWSRKKFTLDKDIVEMVTDTFIKMHQDGLVYRGLRLVNYCTHCGTAFSNLEVDHIERTTPLYYMKYGPFVLATTRPETKFGDTGIMVHPNDKRYQKWVGKTVEVEGLAGKFSIKVIADPTVDMEFGTGVVKVTPAHDFKDFEVWQRHKDEIPGPKQVIGFDGKMTDLAGKYSGLKVGKAREAVVEDLMAGGLLEKIDDKYIHTVGVCYRCGSVIEPLPMKQFYIKVESLTKKVLKALKDKKVKIHGAGYDKILKHWLINLDDWNISRQIVWGIRMPIWYKKNSNKEDFVIAKTSPGKDYEQESDTIDTWFSSSQWPVVTLKTNRSNDFKKFYPTRVMETAYDILVFWVMRMLMMGLYVTNEVPFKDVYLHGLIRDEKGQKMSKSKGNVINPLEVIEKYGADALRMALVMSTTAGRDSNTGDSKIRGMRNLTNKIWNSARFVLEFLEENKEAGGDNEFLTNAKQLVTAVGVNIENLKIGFAAELAYNDFWHWFCDVKIEEAKEGKISKKAMVEGFKMMMIMLHPFVPFVTEAVWEEFRAKGLVQSEELLMNSKWPGV